MLPLDTPISSLPKTHSTTIKRFESLGIDTFGDLLHYLPRKYVDYSQSSPIGNLQPGDIATIKGTVIESKNTYTRRGFTLQQIIINDHTGRLKLTWFNQPYIVKNLPVGTILAAAGEIKRVGQWLTMTPDEYERIRSDDQIQTHTGKIVPLYRQKQGLSSRLIRDKIQYVMEQSSLRDMPDWLPHMIVQRQGLISYPDALAISHNPPDMDAVTKAQKRHAFDELFTIQLAHALIKREWEQTETGVRIRCHNKVGEKIATFLGTLPFTLTDSQKQAWQDILTDMLESHPMNRFLQGDVGSGKTVIAALAAYLTILNGYHVLLMAPTQILAQQHLITFERFFAQHPAVTFKLVTGGASLPKKGSKEKTKPTIYIGTHALLTKHKDLADVGLAIVDEQHRFGVAQRAMLKEKNTRPHVLTMTATPIPRTVALTLFGDLDLSVLTDKPAGRLPIKSWLVPTEKRAGAYDWIRTQIATTGCQVFVICPLIQTDEEDIASKETSVTIKTATDEAHKLQQVIFPHLRVGLLHGKLKSSEKDMVMADFKAKKYDILVSTTVVEVGIDIPNATIIMIEGAERFGLAQLHQLRGRVGRSDKQSYCLLFTSDGVVGGERLSFFAHTTDGGKLAEYDFRQRGPGDIYGTAQSGMGGLNVANLFDYALVSQAKQEAEKILASYSAEAYPLISKRVESYMTQHIANN